jgi:hypothetical protein
MIIVKRHWKLPYINQLGDSSFQEGRLISIEETEEKKQLNNSQLRQKYRDLAIQQFMGKFFTNKNTRTKILVSRQGINKWHLKAGADREKAILIQALNKVIEDSLFLKSEKDYKNRKEIEYSSIFSYILNVNGKTRRVLLRTIKNENAPERFKYLSWDDIVYYR